LRCSGHSAVAAGTVSREISAAAFTRDLFRLSKLWMLSACHVLQKNPQFIFQGFEVCTTRGPILGAYEGQKVPPQPLLSCLGLVGRISVLLEDPFLTT